jgi:hypothetical protein
MGPALIIIACRLRWKLSLPNRFDLCIFALSATISSLSILMYACVVSSCKASLALVVASVATVPQSDAVDVASFVRFVGTDFRWVD